MSTTAAPSAVPEASVMLRIAGQPGPLFRLDASIENTLGRSTEASIAIPDRLASREHAAIRFYPSRNEWILRDVGSRNGTWLNGRRVEAVPLTPGCVMRIGTSELVFLVPESDPPPPPRAAGEGAAIRVVRSAPVAQFEGAALRASGGDHSTEAAQPLAVHEMALRLLAARTPAEIVAAALECALHHSAAKAACWYHVTVTGSWHPFAVTPEAFPMAELFVEPARTLAIRDAHGSWLTHASSEVVGMERGAEVVSMPIGEKGHVGGVLVAAIPRGRLRGPDFGFLVELSRLAAAAHQRCLLPGEPPAAPPAADPDADVTVDLDDHGHHPAATPSALSREGTVVLPSHENPSSADDPLVAGLPCLDLRKWQRRLVFEALRRHAGNLSAAARDLGVEPRNLQQALAKYGMISDGWHKPSM